MVELKISGQPDLVKFELDVQGPVWFSTFFIKEFLASRCV